MDDETIGKIIMYAIQKGDQELWNIIYPYCKENDHKYHMKLVKETAENFDFMWTKNE